MGYYAVGCCCSLLYVSLWSADMKLVDREVERKNEIGNVLGYIHRQLGQLKVVDSLPDSGVPPTALINRSLDVKSAALTYIAIHICHESGRLGTLGIFHWCSANN